MHTLVFRKNNRYFLRKLINKKRWLLTPLLYGLQFLIGSLVTLLPDTYAEWQEKFQFLIGSLVTHHHRGGRKREEAVSIPYR